MIRSVLDTNVLVSGLLNPAGNEALVLLAAHHGLMRVCLSPEIVAEYAVVLAQPKFGFPPDEIAALLAMLHGNGELFHPSPSPFASPDPGDDKMLRCAFTAGADFIVTGNKRHFPQASYGSAQVVSAGELLDRITLEI